LAAPGEFSERAFLNDKIDLTQAEAIADLIDANSKQAARQALNSLKGAFAEEINVLLERLTHLRLYVESAIDFPEEEIDFLGDGIVSEKLNDLLRQVAEVNRKAKQGAAIREGMHVVLAGKPNAGKSTLLNALAEREIAIVTDIEGTTRDTITEHIHINGMPLHITDTAGIRETDNKVEQIGIERAWQAINKADKLLLLVDAAEYDEKKIKLDWSDFFDKPELHNKLSIIINKIDLVQNAQFDVIETTSHFPISAKTGLGVDELRESLCRSMGLENLNEGSFSARRRHLDALARCQSLLEQGQVQLELSAAGELLAEDLRQAQEALGEITGKFSADDLLGKIFSSFCIGK
jgi:tRNA modification GTPase